MYYTPVIPRVLVCKARQESYHQPAARAPAGRSFRWYPTRCSKYDGSQALGASMRGRDSTASDSKYICICIYILYIYIVIIMIIIIIAAKTRTIIIVRIINMYVYIYNYIHIHLT